MKLEAYRFEIAVCACITLLIFACATIGVWLFSPGIYSCSEAIEFSSRFKNIEECQFSSTIGNLLVLPSVLPLLATGAMLSVLNPFVGVYGFKEEHLTLLVLFLSFLFGIVELFALTALCSLALRKTFLYSLFSNEKWPKTFGLIQKAFIAFFTFAILLAIYALHVEPFNVKVTENTFDFFHSSEPLKIVLISDTQTAYDYPGYLEKVVAHVNSLNPDIILIAGDIVDGEPDGFRHLGALKGLHAPYGIYAVLGNHDYIKMSSGWYNPDVACTNAAQEEYGSQVRQTVESFGIKVFKNEYRMMDIRGKSFALVGLDDWWACKSNYQKAVENLSSNIPQIVLVHEQEGYTKTVTREPNRALVLAGHTHCGQVRVPFIGSIPKQFGFEGDVDMGRASLSNTTDIYVSCGVTPGRIRFGAPPEISVIYIR